MIRQFTSFFKEHLKIFDTDQIPSNPMLSPLIICKLSGNGSHCICHQGIPETAPGDHGINVDQAVEAYYFLVSSFPARKRDFRPKLFPGGGSKLHYAAFQELTLDATAGRPWVLRRTPIGADEGLCPSGKAQKAYTVV